MLNEVEYLAELQDVENASQAWPLNSTPQDTTLGHYFSGDSSSQT